jgi:hypothetical protein
MALFWFLRSKLGKIPVFCSTFSSLMLKMDEFSLKKLGNLCNNKKLKAHT